MNRAERRHNALVAKVRKLNLLAHLNSPWWKTWYHCSVSGKIRPLYDPPKVWRQTGRLAMMTPMSHHRETLHRPARVRSRHLCHLVSRGTDPDAFRWPDSKKPYLYYW